MEDMSIREMTVEEVRKAIKRAIDGGSKEAEFILTIEEVSEKAGVSVHNRMLKVVVGNPIIVTLDEEHRENGSDYRDWSRVAIVPTEIPTLVIVTDEYNGWDEREYSEILYVFTVDGWKKVTIR